MWTAVLFMGASSWLWLVGLTSAGWAGYGAARHRFEGPGMVFVASLVVLSWMSRRFGSAPGDATRRRGLLHLVLPSLSAVAAFGWALALGPLSDDYVLWSWARAGNLTPAEWQFFRPFPLATWWSLSAMGAGWVTLHVVNVGLHALNSALVAHIAARYLGQRSGLVAGVVFAMFPASAEAVAWNAGVFDVMAASCVLGAVAVWLSDHAFLQPHRRAVLLTVLCLAGVLAKESAVAVLPLLLLTIPLATSPRHFARSRTVSLVVMLVVVTAFVGVRAGQSPTVAGHLQNFPSGRYEWKEFLVRPFAGVALPLRTDEGRSAGAHLAGLMMLSVAGLVFVRAAFAGRSRADRVASGGVSPRLTLLGIGWIMIASVPVLTDFYVSPSLAGSRYLYLPCAGLAFAVSSAFAPGRKADRGRLHDYVAVASVLMLLATWGMGLVQERGVWREAARVRDNLLGDARDASSAAGCRALTVVDAPDNVRGAYVFREGLAQALEPLSAGPTGPACTFKWTGTSLSPAEPPSPVVP